MNIAIRYGSAIVDADGHVSGHDAGATLVRRLLRVFPEARLIGPGPRQGEGVGDHHVVVGQPVDQ